MLSIGADSLFAVDFSIAYLLLYCVCRVFGGNRRRRVFICALLIAIPETLTLFSLPEPLCAFLLWAGRIGSAILLAPKKSLIQEGAFLFLYVSLDRIVTSALTQLYTKMPEIPNTAGGFSARLSPDRAMPALFTFCALCALLCFSKYRKRRPKTVSVRLVFAGRELRCTAYSDSGNLLRDPVSGLPVMVIGKDAADRLGNVRKETLTRAGKLRLVPVRTVVGSALLPAFVPDLLQIDGKERKICVALDLNSTSYGGCEALIGADAI